MNQLIEKEIKMTSLELVDITGKQHTHIMRDIRNEIDSLGEETGQSIFGLTSYKDQWNREQPCYEFGKDGAMQLALKYDAITRRKVILKLEELEKMQVPIQYQEMSPQLQFMINMEAEQKRQAREQERQAQEITAVKETQKTIAQALGKDIIEDFRSWVSRSLSAIAESNNYPYIGSQQERHQAVRKESYERLNAKRPCRLDQRVDGERGRAAAAGASQTRIKAINKLTIIEGDKDLKPVYESVIREMLVTYCVTVK